MATKDIAAYSVLTHLEYQVVHSYFEWSSLNCPHSVNCFSNPFLFIFFFNSKLSDAECLLDISEDFDNDKIDNLSTEKLEKKIKFLERENRDLNRKLQEALAKIAQMQNGIDQPSVSGDDVSDLRQLKEEVAVLHRVVAGEPFDIDGSIEYISV